MKRDRSRNSLNKYRLLFSLVLLSNASIGAGIHFSMSCQLLDQVLLTVKDGRSKRFSGYDGGPDIGDTVCFQFVFEQESADKYIVALRSKDWPIDLYTFSEVGRVVHSSEMRFIKFQRAEAGMFVGDNFFSSHGGRIKIDGARYYKNDWSFSLSRHGDNNVYTQTLNCMGMPDAYNNVIDEMLAVHDN